MKTSFSKGQKCILPFIGFLSLIWFLFRVIPKPSRAVYPCMKTAFPLASSFSIYILGLLSSSYLFKKSKFLWNNSNYILSISFIIIAIFVAFATMSPNQKANAVPLVEMPPDSANNPMGVGIGIMPGRVAWIYNPDATDENCTNYADPQGDMDMWFMDYNTKQNIVNQMFEDGLKLLTNTNSVGVAWDSIFHYYNRTHGRGNVGYKTDEKIVMKINLNAESGFLTGIEGMPVDLKNEFLRKINTSPQLVYAIIKSLVNVAGVSQKNIGFGDPGKSTGDIYLNKIKKTFPDVVIWNSDAKYAINRTSAESFKTSDGKLDLDIPICYYQATYMINIPVLKKHHRAGISVCSKNHFGSLYAGMLHYSLPASGGFGDIDNGKYGTYRCFVDIMGYKHLGGKTILYVVDGLWGSTNWAHPAIKWMMSPFNNDWPSSLLMSQDPVAVESVCFDFLFKEFDKEHPTEGTTDPNDNVGPFPHYPGTDDFLHQSADPKNWPATIKYAPSGVQLKSLGAHEHWNNAEDKQYSRNLGLNKGIELVSNYITNITDFSSTFNAELTNFPNPFSVYTVFSYNLPSTSNVSLFVYDIKGSLIRELVNYEQYAGKQEVNWDGLDNSGLVIKANVYFAKLSIRTGGRFYYQTLKVVRQ